MTIHEELDQLRQLIASNKIAELSKTQLERYSEVLCFSQASSYFADQQFVQVCETIRLLLFKKHMDTLAEEAGKSAKKTEKLTGRLLFLTWVIVVLTAVLVLTVFFEFPKITIKLNQQPNFSTEKANKDSTQDAPNDKFIKNEPYEMPNTYKASPCQ